MRRAPGGRHLWLRERLAQHPRSQVDDVLSRVRVACCEESAIDIDEQALLVALSVLDRRAVHVEAALFLFVLSGLAA